MREARPIPAGGPTCTARVMCILLALAASSCQNSEPDRQYLIRTDMYVQPSFKHNRDPRPPVAGTVALEEVASGLRDSSRVVGMKNPFMFPPASADTAKRLFETYCSPCHGLGATGDGRVAQKFQTPPNLTSLKYARLADGYFFWVMSHGVRIMPPYFENTTPRERWMIVTRLRSLQEQ